MTQNTFAQLSDAYARARPHYPPELYLWLTTRAPASGAVWDCATGSGQAAVSLADHFATVYATDSSPEQLAHAARRQNIVYHVAAAEGSGLASHSVDVVTVAQALHWFDHDRFWPEVARVARRGALFCAWGYAWMTVNEVVDEVLIRPYRSLLLPFWNSRNRILWEGYQKDAIAFPFEAIACPELEIRVEWTVDEIIAYMGTWSAYKNSRADADAVAASARADEKARAAIDRDETLVVRMPLMIVAGYVTHPDSRTRGNDPGPTPS